MSSEWQDRIHPGDFSRAMLAGLGIPITLGASYRELRVAEAELTDALEDDIAAFQRRLERQLEELRAEMKRQNDIHERVVAISGREVVRTLADLVSGEIGGRITSRLELRGHGRDHHGVLGPGRLVPVAPDPTSKTVETKRPDDDPAWTKAVIAQADGTCEYVHAGERCTGKTDLKAYAPRPTKRPEEGAALCPSHYDMVVKGTEE